MRVLLIFLLIASCTSVQKLDENTAYKKDIIVHVNGAKLLGVGVVSKAEIYRIQVNSHGNLDVLTFNSCHRETVFEKVSTKKKFWRKDKKKFVFNYTPTTTIEAKCPLEFGAYDTKGRHGWAYLVLDREGLASTTYCNGEKRENGGVSICQSKAGLEQIIEFKEDVKYLSTCGHKGNSKTITYEIEKGFCYFSFKSKAGKIHDHVAYGYEKFILRKQ